MKTVSSLLGIFNSHMRHRSTGSAFPQKAAIPLIYGLPHPWNWDTDMFSSRHWKAQHSSLFLYFFFLSSLKKVFPVKLTFSITSGSNPWWLPAYPNWLSHSQPRRGVWTDKQKKMIQICWDREKTLTSRKYKPSENMSQHSVSQLLFFLLWAIKNVLESLWVPKNFSQAKSAGPAGPCGVGIRIQLRVFWNALAVKTFYLISK